jgi:hypothetical protein
VELEDLVVVEEDTLVLVGLGQLVKDLLEETVLHQEMVAVVELEVLVDLEAHV